MSNVIPIRNLWGEAHDLAENIYETMGSMPADDLTEGYRLTPDTQRELLRIVALLTQAATTLQSAYEREVQLYGTYCDEREDLVEGD